MIDIDILRNFNDGEIFFIYSGDDDNYFWIKHNGRVMPVTIRYNRNSRLYYMTMDARQ